MPDLWWLRHFPNGLRADAAMYRTLDEDAALFTAAGLQPAPGLVMVNEPSLGSRRQRLAQLRTRTLSVLHRMSDEDFAAGLASLEREVASEPGSVVTRKPGDIAGDAETCNERQHHAEAAHGKRGGRREARLGNVPG